MNEKTIFLECCSRVKLQKNPNETKKIEALGLYEIEDERLINDHPHYYNRADKTTLFFKEEGWVVSSRHFISHNIFSFDLKDVSITIEYLSYIFLSRERWKAIPTTF